eukprot:505989_1
MSTLSIDSELQPNNEYINGSMVHNLCVEDESLMDDYNISPRIKNSKIIEFYVPKHMNIEQIKRCFGIFEPIKIIPHMIENNTELQGKDKKIEAIFSDHSRAVKAVQMLKHQDLQVVFKKSPRQTLVSKSNQTPKLIPISSQGPFQSFNQHQNNMPNKNKLNLVGNDSMCSSNMGDDFGTIQYKPHRVGQQNQNIGQQNDDDESYEWTEGSSSNNNNSDNSNDDDSDSQVWALEQGFSGSSDDNDDDNNNNNNDNDNNIL